MPKVQSIKALTGAGDPSGLATAAQTAGIAGRKLTLLLAPGHYRIVQVDTPAVPRAEWRAALRFSPAFKEMLDTPVDALVFDVLEIPTENYVANRPKQSLAFVAKKAELAPLVECFDTAGLRLEAIDVPELALRNIAALLEDENRGLALFAFDAWGGMLVITFKGELYASRRIEISPEQFAQANDERKTALHERIALELQRSLDAFDRLYSFITLSRLVVAPHPDVPDLLDVLRDNVATRVEALNLGSRLEFAAEAMRDPAALSKSLLAIGAALRPDAPAEADAK
ncbi:MAG: hypothetical protein LBL69_03460 [Zoogloeaceae bacterium]|nr:hypothetical protein [Zoogloeaceae bacterium]